MVIDLTPGESQRDMHKFIGQELAVNTDKALEDERVKWGYPSFQDKNWWRNHSRVETDIQSGTAITVYYVDNRRFLTEMLRYVGDGSYRQSFTTYKPTNNAFAEVDKTDS